MPKKKTVEKARKAKRQGKSPSTQAGEFVREEIHDIRSGKHGARSPEQAIAIGLSKARRAGVDLPPPEPGKTSEKTRKAAKADYDAGHGRPHGKLSPKRSRATAKALKRESKSAASHEALSQHATKAAKKRTAAERSAAAKKAARTKGPAARKAAAKKAAKTKGAAGRKAAAKKAARTRKQR